MSEHTKLPWAYKSNGHYFDIGVDHQSEALPIYPCAVIGVPHEQEDNARLIVTAVNNHERLVEALAEMVELYESEVHDSWDGTSQVDAMLGKADKARALLAALEAEKGGE